MTIKGSALNGGNSFANGMGGQVQIQPPMGLIKLLGAAYADAKAMSTTIYDLGA